MTYGEDDRPAPTAAREPSSPQEPFYSNNNNNNNIPEVQDSSDSEHEAQAAVHLLDFTNVHRLSETRRFVILTAASFAMICASTSYAFNLFSKQLRDKYNYNSRDMSNINTVGMCIAYFLTPYGFLFDFFGPLPIYIIACVLFSAGSLMMGLTFQDVVEGNVARFCVYNALLSLGSQLFDLATVVTLMSVFPTRKGWVVALLKTLMGLGSAILASIKTGFFTTASSYFYFLIGLVVVVALAVMVLVRLPSYHLTGYEKKYLSEEEKAKRLVHRTAYLTQEPPMWRFYWGIGVILLLVVYLPTTSAVSAFCKISSSTPMAFAIVAIILTCLLLCMMIPVPWLDRQTTKKTGTPLDLDYDKNNNNNNEMEEEEDEEELNACAGEPVGKQLRDSSSDSPRDGGEGLQDELRLATTDELGDLDHQTNNNNNNNNNNNKIQTDVDFIAPQYQTTFLQSCCTLRLWCIFWTMFCGLGCEFVIIFNATAIYEARTGAPVDNTVGALLTVLNGAGSAIGRLAMSAFEIYTQNQRPDRRMPITYAFFVPTSFLITSITLFLVLPGRSLLLAYTIAALGNGFCASITILVLRTLYAKDPAKHYNFTIVSLVPAAILLNRFLYGEWIAVQADKQHSKVCYGRVCVLMPMCVMIGLNCTAFASTLYVHFSYMNFCKKVLAERRRLREEKEEEATMLLENAATSSS